MLCQQLKLLRLGRNMRLRKNYTQDQHDTYEYYP